MSRSVNPLYFRAVAEVLRTKAARLELGAKLSPAKHRRILLDAAVELDRFWEAWEAMELKVKTAEAWRAGFDAGQFMAKEKGEE